MFDMETQYWIILEHLTLLSQDVLSKVVVKVCLYRPVCVSKLPKPRKEHFLSDDRLLSTSGLPAIHGGIR